MMEEKAAEMWRAMREMMLEVQKSKDAEVAAISEELLRCKEENRRMKEDGAKMRLEIERLSAVGNLLDRDVQPSLFRDAGISRRISQPLPRFGRHAGRSHPSSAS